MTERSMNGEPRGPKAISVRQPWAWAIVHGGKNIENRSEAAARVMEHAVGRRIFIHAAKSFHRDDYEESIAFLRSLGVAAPDRQSMALGGVIGSVKLAGIVRRSASPWFSGPCGLQLADPSPCPFFAVKGRLNLFYVTPPEGIAP